MLELERRYDWETAEKNYEKKKKDEPDMDQEYTQGIYIWAWCHWSNMGEDQFG